MKAFAVLTATGPDRVGVVDEFSSHLLAQACNIEESRMAVLGGEFAMIVLVSGTTESVTELLERIDHGSLLEGFEVAGRRTGEHTVPKDGRPYRIESTSLDTPGIVHAVTAVLRAHDINIDDLETETSGAPFTGAPMFHVRMMVVVPSGVSVSQLRRELNEVADTRDLDVTVRPVIAAADE